MSAWQRTLAVTLVTLGGLLAGFVVYRALLRPSALRAALPVGDAEPAVVQPKLPVPDTVPDARLPGLDGTSRSLRDFLGGPLVINFWATWCAPCRREIPLLQQLRHEHSGERLQVVGVAVDFRAAVESYQRQQPIDYPLLVGEQQGLAAVQQFGMDTVLPFSVFALADGRIVAIKVGELHRDDADTILATMKAVASGQQTLAAARENIANRLRQLAIDRAKAGIATS